MNERAFAARESGREGGREARNTDACLRLISDIECMFVNVALINQRHVDGTARNRSAGANTCTS